MATEGQGGSKFRPWMGYVLAGVVGIGIGGAASSSEDEPAQVRTETITRTVKEAPDRSELDAVEEQLADRRSDLRESKADVASVKRTLKRLEGQLGAARQEVARSTFDGDGTFLVGKDIEPGTYRADARPGCYWARLASLDTSSIDAILANENSDGPVVIQVSSSDVAVQVARCGQFRLIE